MNLTLWNYESFFEKVIVIPGQRKVVEEAFRYLSANHLNVEIAYSLYEDKSLESLSFKDVHSKLFHRPYEEGPSYYAWFENGSPEMITYHKNDLLHRDPYEGPAHESWIRKDEKYAIEYFWEGKEVSSTYIIPARQPKPDGLGRVFL